MMIKKLLGILPSLFFLSVFSFSGQASAGLVLVGNDQAHIDLGAGFGAVGWVNVDRGNGITGIGSFSVIDDGRWGITSKHVLLSNESDPTSFFSNIRVGFGNYLTNPLQTTSAFDIYVNDTKDLALFHFDNVFSGITPLQRFTGNVVNGIEGYTVGYGQLQYVNDPNATFTGDKRAGFDVVNGVNPFEPDNFRTRVDFNFIPEYRPLEMGIRPGDSGGAFVQANSGLPTNLLAGIIDSGQLLNGFGTSSYFTRLDNQWIDATKSSAAVPEPTSIALVTVGIGYIVRKKKKKFSAV